MKRFPLWFFAALLALLAACGSPTPPEDEEPTYPAVAHEDTRVLDDVARAAMQSFDLGSGALVFAGADLPVFEVGNVVVSQPTAAAPYGLLRRVTAVDDTVAGQLSLETEIASLDMALESGSLYQSFGLRMEDIAEVEYHVEGVRMFDPADPAERARLAALSGDGAAPLALPPDFIGWSFDDLVIYDDDGNLSTKNDQILVRGDAGLRPIFDMGFALNCSYWCARTNPYFKFEVGAQVLARLALDSKVAFGLNFSKTLTLATLTGTPITFSIGPIPVVIVPKFKLELRFDGAIGFNVSYEVQGDMTLKAGAQYKNGSWSNISGFEQDFKSQPVNADSFVNVGVRAKLKGAIRGELMFYGVVGIYAEIVPLAGIDIAYPRAPVWKINAGIEVNAGVTIDVILFKKDWKAELIDLEWQIAQSDNTAPEVTILSTSPVQVGPNGFNLRAVVRDAEDGGDCCSTTFRSSNPADGVGGLLGSVTSPSPEVPVSFATAGTRTITVTATDSEGDQTSKTLSLEVVNTLPQLTITAPHDGQSFYAGQQVRFRSFNYDPNEVDFAVPCEQLSWSEGATLGSGCTLTLPGGFAEGQRSIVLSATDSHGGSSSVTVALDIGPAPDNYPPVVTIDSPQDYQWIGRTELLDLVFSAIDPEGDGTTDVSWDALLYYDPATGSGTELHAVEPDGNGQWSLSQLTGFGTDVCEVSMLIRLRVRVTDTEGGVGEDFIVLRYAYIC